MRKVFEAVISLVMLREEDPDDSPHGHITSLVSLHPLDLLCCNPLSLTGCAQDSSQTGPRSEAHGSGEDWQDVYTIQTEVCSLKLIVTWLR